MDIMELGAIGELVGGIAVVGSLIFVGLQIRTNTKTVTADANTRAMMEWSHFNRFASHHPDRNTISKMFDPAQHFSEFTPSERQTVVFIGRAMAQQVEAQFFQYRAHLLDPEVWDRRIRTFATLVSFPAFGEWWREEQAMPIYTESFLNAVRGTSGSVVSSDTVLGPSDTRASESEASTQ